MFDERQYCETVYGVLPTDIWNAYRAKQATAQFTEDGELITDIRIDPKVGWEMVQ